MQQYARVFVKTCGVRLYIGLSQEHRSVNTHDVTIPSESFKILNVARVIDEIRRVQTIVLKLSLF